MLFCRSILYQSQLLSGFLLLEDENLSDAISLLWDVNLLHNSISWGRDSVHLHCRCPYADEVANLGDRSVHSPAGSLKPHKLNYGFWYSWSSGIPLTYKLPSGESRGRTETHPALECMPFSTWLFGDNLDSFKCTVKTAWHNLRLQADGWQLCGCSSQPFGFIPA